MIHSHLRRIFVLLLITGAAIPGLMAGPKLKVLMQNMVLLKEGTLLVPPILPDPGEVKRLQASKGDTAVAAYLGRINESNLNLKQYIETEFTFCKVQFLLDEPAVQTYDTYFSFLRQFPKDKYFVLQFGHAVQWASGSFQDIKKYDTEFLGIYEPDCSTRVYLQGAYLNKFNIDHHAQNVIEALQMNVSRYHVLALKKVKKGKLRKKKQQQAEEPAGEEIASGDFMKNAIVVSRVKLQNSEDSARYGAGGWRTVQTTREITVYRHFGGKALLSGREATSRQYAASNEARGLLCIPGFNTITWEAAIRVPAGTKLQIGRAAPYPAANPIHPGGDEIIFFIAGWNPAWLVQVKEMASGKVFTAEEWKAAHPAE